MEFIRASVMFRRLMWRLGRRIYTYARCDDHNDPRTNGEYWLLGQALKGSAGPQVLLDIGANRGDWTAQAVELAPEPKTVHVHAFEPSLATRSMLTARFRENPSVTVQPYALSDTTGEAGFYSEMDGAGTNSLSPESGLNVETVKLITLDGFLQQSGIDAISIAKIDTEGFDLLVMRGAEKALQNGRIGILQFEYNWRWLINHACLRDVFDLISDKPYRFGKVTRNGVETYDQWHFELDRYFEGNYVLIRKDLDFEIGESFMYFDDSNTANHNSNSRSVS